MIVIRPASDEDAVWLSSRLRSEDVQEVETATGRSPHEIVPLSFRLSDESYTVRRVVDGRIAVDPVAIFGACADPTNPLKGIVWFLGTRDVRLCALSLITESARWLNHMSRRYPQGLHNYADSRNSLHIRWCQLTGFELGETVEIHGVPFHPIHRPQCVTQ
jgi:hypothetical protein